MSWPLLNGDWNFWPDGLSRDEAWARCAELGFDGIEVGVYSSVSELSPRHLSDYRELEQRYGIGVRAVLFSLPRERWPGGAFAVAGEGDRAVKEAVEIGARAGELGIDWIGIWDGADVLSREVSYRDAWPRLVDSIARTAAALAPQGVRVGVEYKPHELIANPDAALRLCESTGSSDVGVILDTGHALWAGEDLPVVVDMLGERLFHVHLGDSPPGVEGDLPPGRRHNFVPFFSALAGSGYRGALSLDMYGAVADGLATGEEASTEGRDYVRQSIELAGAAG